jgi:polysaccharide deacetylase family protein (PEP-CTERM system associated)
MNNGLTVDLEFWYCNEFIKKFIPNNNHNYIVESVEKILLLFQKHNVKATFFVLGIVAEKYPDLIKKIYNNGHEIASHGYTHELITNLDEKTFEKEIKNSVELLDSIIGEKPIGFRASNFSVNNSTKWVFKVLNRYGFKYDSSIFPIKTNLYGVYEAPLDVYRPSINDVTKHDPNGKIIEFPLTVFNFIKNIPISGGFYLRILPTYIILNGFKKINKERRGVLYFHPWELNSNIPYLNVPFLTRFFTYYGKKRVVKKIDKIIDKLNFKPLKEILHEI